MTADASTSIEVHSVRMNWLLADLRTTIGRRMSVIATTRNPRENRPMSCSFLEKRNHVSRLTSMHW